MYVHCCCLQTHQKRASDPISDGCEPPHGCWEPGSDFLVFPITMGCVLICELESSFFKLNTFLYIVKEFIDDLQSAVQLPTMVSCSCEWKSKDLAVAQSNKAKEKDVVSAFSPVHLGSGDRRAS